MFVTVKGLSMWRVCVLAPLPNVAAHLIQTPRTTVFAESLNRKRLLFALILITTAMVAAIPIRSPGIGSPVHPSRSIFPFQFSRQAKIGPFAISLCTKPTHVYDWMILLAAIRLITLMMQFALIEDRFNKMPTAFSAVGSIAKIHVGNLFHIPGAAKSVEEVSFCRWIEVSK